MWFMDEAGKDEQDVRSLTLRILTVNFAAIHTSSMVSFVTPCLHTHIFDVFVELHSCAVSLGGQSGVYTTSSRGG